MRRKEFNGRELKALKQPEITEAIEKLIIEQISRKTGIRSTEIKKILERKGETDEESFPAIILRDKLSPLEAITKYLRENKTLTYKQISKLLNRTTGSLAVTYKNATEKKPERFPISIENDKNRVSYNAFLQDLSVLESIGLHLQEKGLKHSEIARITGKDPRTIWTVINRAQKKLEAAHG